MGGNQSKKCIAPLQNPDLLNVVTLSDAAVQRLPLDSEDSPLDKEQRNQNIDDFWRDRLLCLENTYAEARRMTEKEFSRLEFEIGKMAVGQGKLMCPRNVEDTATCYMTYSNEPLKCKQLVSKLQLCINTILSESAMRRYKEELRKNRKKACG